MLKIVIIFLCLCILFYLLYINGILVINAKRAVMFVGSIRGNSHCRASFSSCTGYIKRVIRFKESKTYQFTLHSELENGELEVMILTSSQQPVVSLNSAQRNAVVDMDCSKRYYLIFTFRSATGTYELNWD